MDPLGLGLELGHACWSFAVMGARWAPPWVDGGKRIDTCWSISPKGPRYLNMECMLLGVLIMILGMCSVFGFLDP